MLGNNSHKKPLADTLRELFLNEKMNGLIAGQKDNKSFGQHADAFRTTTLRV